MQVRRAVGKGQSWKEEAEPGTVVSARCASLQGGPPGDLNGWSGTLSPFGALGLWGLPWADSKAGLSGLRAAGTMDRMVASGT